MVGSEAPSRLSLVAIPDTTGPLPTAPMVSYRRHSDRSRAAAATGNILPASRRDLRMTIPRARPERARLQREEERRIPADFAFAAIPGLSREVIEKLSAIRP